MLGGMYSAATGISAAEQNQEIISRNLAHVDTTGYRRQIGPFESLYASARDGTVNRGTQLGEVETDFTPGILETTQRSLDVAIVGDGFFELETPQGPRYTRNGVFYVGTSGELVAASGYTVQGEGGALRIPSTITPDQIEIAEDGTMSAAGLPLGQLKLVRFANTRQLLPEGVTLFAANGQTAEAADAIVRQGVLERSNVSATQELIHMIVGLRHHEAAQKALRSLSETLQQHTQS